MIEKKKINWPICFNVYLQAINVVTQHVWSTRTGGLFVHEFRRIHCRASSLRLFGKNVFRDSISMQNSRQKALFSFSLYAGSIRTSCHIMPPKCPERPCMHGGSCEEGWNRYICQCQDTSFTGPTCGKRELQSTYFCCCLPLFFLHW